MARRTFGSVFARAYQRNLRTLTKATVKNATRIARTTSKQVGAAAANQLKPPPGKGDWLGGMAIGPGGARFYHLYRPARLRFSFGAKPSLMVMLHGCYQTGRDFAASTRMNLLAERHGFLVLYPEQDRFTTPNGCWNWYDTDAGNSQAEAATLMAAIDQVCLMYGADLTRVAVTGFSAGAGMAALLAMRHPARFRAVVMHSGVAPGAATAPKMVLNAMRGRNPPKMSDVAGETLPPLLVLQGDRDAVVSERNAAGAAALWAVATGARPAGTRVVKRGARRTMRVTDFKRAGRTTVTLWHIEGLRHAWSGGAAKIRFSDPDGPDATRAAWAFAAKQFLSAAVD